MEIVINTIPLLSPLTGVGHYTYQIAKHLRTIDSSNDYTYFYGYYSKKLFTYKENRGKFYRIKEIVKKNHTVSLALRGLSGAINKFSSSNFDLYFEPNTIPINIRAKYIITMVPDFSLKVHPEWHPKDRVVYFERNFIKNVDRIDRIIVISDYIKRSAMELFKFPESKLKTIYLGIDTGVFKVYAPQDLLHVKERYSLPHNFILFVGSIEPRKNLKNLLLSYRILREKTGRDFKLVLAGFKGWENKAIMDLLDSVRNEVLYIGYIPDEELGKLYNLADLFVFPSFYEGFGLPPLEAMACGCPVVTSRAASLPEVCGDAAYYVDPYDTESIADGMYNVLIDSLLRQNLINKGLERSRLFSWKDSAQEHLKTFEETVQ